MNRLVLVCAFLLCACSHAPVVSDFSEAPWDPMKGSVIPLERAIEGSKETVVVLIHGVGDQCPGYALEKGGWLNNDTAQKFGIRSVSITAPVSIPDSQFLDKRDDPNSSVSYRVAEFIYTPSSGATPRKIKAIEITWSALTQWVKSQQLGYDIPKIKPPAADGSQNCYYQLPPSHPDHPPTDFPYSRPPPTRVTLNRLVKEQVFDRSLADAILYVGDYGVAIQRGVAQALCMAMGGTRHVDEAGGHVDSAICKWPETDSIEDSQKFIFVTHSLGGRVLYDTLLGLTGDRVNPHHSTFSDQGRYSEVRRSRNYVCRMIAHTAGIYMMANQLTLLGLAYDDAKHISSDGPQPYDVQHTTPTRGCGYYEEPEPELLKPDAAFVDQRPDPEPHDTSQRWSCLEKFGAEQEK